MFPDNNFESFLSASSLFKIAENGVVRKRTYTTNWTVSQIDIKIFVRLLATSSKNYWSNLHESFARGVCLDNKDTLKF